MKLEEYLVKRKKEDGINEYDYDKRSENTRICVNYIFEYFNNYLDTRPGDEKTALHEQKVEKYRNIIREYDTSVREWLVALYSSYGKYMHRQLMNFITDDYFLLYDSEAEFRAISYEIYPKAVKKFGFLEGLSEMIFQFIKEEHRVRGLLLYNDFHISDTVNEWIHDTYKKHGVNIYNFCNEWVGSYYDNPDIWPKGHKKKNDYYAQRSKIDGYSVSRSLLWDYDYKQKSNLFGLDNLYRGMPKKSFIKGRKQEFEATLLYCWLHSIMSDDEYWEEYSQNVL